MGLSNAELLRKAAGPIGTGDFETSGILSAEQATSFLDAVYDATPFAALQRNERRRVKSGTVAKVGIGSRLLRPKTAGVDDATLQKPSFGDVSYTCVAMRLDWEVEEEVLQENIEQEGFEDHLMRLMTGQIGRDLEDLHFNGDDTSDDAMLVANDGWLVQLAASGTTHRMNGASVNAGVICKDHFFDAYQALPDKCKNNPAGLRWLCSPTVESRWLEYLTNRATAAGDAALFGQAGRNPHGVPIQTIPAMPNTRLLLADPRNFIVVNTRDIRIRKTTEGREAIREDKRYYAIFLNDDPIIEEDDGIVDTYGLAA